MVEKINIAIDAMGGDNAPKEIIKGCIEALEQNSNINITLVGKKDIIEKELIKYNFSENIKIEDATEIISSDESPVTAIRKKKNSSIVIGMNLVKSKNADAFISAGSTGALLAGGTLIIGRIKGVQRPALAPLLPTLKGNTMLIDCGANVDAKPSYLHQFAKLGSIYCENVLNIHNPKVGLINIGTEKGKGNDLVKETYTLLEEDNTINFVGNIESRDITDGEVDIVVCDAFVGNVLLKNMEGMGNFIFKILKEEINNSFRYKIGALILKPLFKKIHKRFDSSEQGGVPLLGLNDLVIKAHGSSDSKAIKNAILKAKEFLDADVNKIIQENI